MRSIRVNFRREHDETLAPQSGQHPVNSRSPDCVNHSQANDSTPLGVTVLGTASSVSVAVPVRVGMQLARCMSVTMSMDEIRTEK